VKLKPPQPRSPKQVFSPYDWLPHSLCLIPRLVIPDTSKSRDRKPSLRWGNLFLFSVSDTFFPMHSPSLFFWSRTSPVAPPPRPLQEDADGSSAPMCFFRSLFRDLLSLFSVHVSVILAPHDPLFCRSLRGIPCNQVDRLSTSSLPLPFRFFFPFFDTHVSPLLGFWQAAPLLLTFVFCDPVAFTYLRVLV